MVRRGLETKKLFGLDGVAEEDEFCYSHGLELDKAYYTGEFMCCFRRAQVYR